MKSLYIQNFFHSNSSKKPEYGRHSFHQGGPGTKVVAHPSIDFAQEVKEGREQYHHFQHDIVLESTSEGQIRQPQAGKEGGNSHLKTTIINGPADSQEQETNTWDVSKRLDPTKVFVSFKDKSIHERMLANIFKRFGKIRNSFLGKNSSKNLVSFGFIKFYDPKAASQAIACGRVTSKTGSEITIKPGLKKGSSKLKKKFLSKNQGLPVEGEPSSQRNNNPDQAVDYYRLNRINRVERKSGKKVFQSALEVTSSLSSQIEERHRNMVSVGGLRFNTVSSGMSTKKRL